MNAYRNASKVGFVIMLFGLVIMIYGFSFLLSLQSLSENAIKVEGEVIEIAKKAIYRSPIVRFTTLDGETKTFRSDFEVNKDFFTYTIGQKVPVIYHKNDPDNARIDAFWEKHFAQIFLGCFGVFLLFLGWFLRRLFLKKAKKYD